jgi:predicted dehydrogenase
VSHLPALVATPGLRLTAVSTTRQESARRAAARWAVPHHFTTAIDLARCPDVDLVTISVKAPLHRSLIEEVLDAGKPILCEWPLGTSAAESAYLAETLEDRGIRAFVALQATAHPVLRQLGTSVRDGQLGTLLAVAVTSTRASKDPLPTGSAYTLRSENGAGMMQILGGHGIAALATAVGTPLNLLTPGSGTARLVNPLRTTDDGGHVTATSPDSVAATIPLGEIAGTLSLADGDVEPGTTITIIGSEARIDATTTPVEEPRLRQPQMADWTARLTTRQGVREIVTEPDDLPLAARNPARLYRTILDDLRHGTTAAPTASDAVAVHRVIDGWRRPAGA